MRPNVEGLCDWHQTVPLPRNRQTSPSPPRKDEIQLAPTIGDGTHMGIWLECIRQRKPHATNAPVEVGHRSASLCHLGNVAVRLGRNVKWDPNRERFPGDDEANEMLLRPLRAPWTL